GWRIAQCRRARIRNRDIQSVKSLSCAANKGLHAFAVDNIEGGTVDLGAAALERRNGCFHVGLAAGTDSCVRSLSCQAFCDGSPDAARTAEDYGPFALQMKIHASSCVTELSPKKAGRPG